MQNQFRGQILIKMTFRFKCRINLETKPWSKWHSVWKSV